MKRLLIATVIAMGLGTATLSCCFNPFFYMPLEKPGAADTHTSPAVTALNGAGTIGDKAPNPGDR